MIIAESSKKSHSMYILALIDILKVLGIAPRSN